MASEAVELSRELIILQCNLLRELDLYSRDETREFIIKHSQLTSKLSAPVHTKNDFLEYIDYDRMFLEDLKIRRRKRNISDKKKEIDQQVINRVKTNFNCVIREYPEDQNLHKAYYTFCKDNNEVHGMIEALRDWERKHPYSTEVWLEEANYYATDGQDKNKAVAKIKKGLEYNKDSQALYRELFRLALSDTIKQDLQLQTNVKAYVLKMLEDIKQVSFYVEIFNKLSSCSWAIESQRLIIERVKKIVDSMGDELAWDALARCTRKGLHLGTELSPQSNNGEEAKAQRVTTKSCLASSISIYQEGLTKVSRERVPKLWELYLGSMMEVYQEKYLATAQESRRKALWEALAEAEKAEDAEMEKNKLMWKPYLQDTHYSIWIESVLELKPDKALEIAVRATSKHPQSAGLWVGRYKCAALKGDDNDVNTTFEEGKLVLKERALPLWNAVVRYHMLLSPNVVVDSIFQAMKKEPFEIRDALMPQYLEWLALKNPIQYVRKEYEELAAIGPPYCKQLHYSMSRIENMLMKFDMKTWERPLRKACEQFGDTDADVYVQLVKLFLTHAQWYRGDSLKNLYEEAQHRLPEAEFNVFKEKYNKFVD